MKGQSLGQKTDTRRQQPTYGTARLVGLKPRIAQRLPKNLRRSSQEITHDNGGALDVFSPTTRKNCRENFIALQCLQMHRGEKKKRRFIRRRESSVTPRPRKRLE